MLTAFYLSVVAEKYDEVVFTNPKMEFHKSLLDGHKKKKLRYPLSNEQSVADHFRTYGDEEDVKSMLEAKKFLEGELRNVKDRLLRADAELEEAKHALAVTKEMEAAGGTGVAAASGGTAKEGAKEKGKPGRKPKKKDKSSEPAGKKARTS